MRLGARELSPNARRLLQPPLIRLGKRGCAAELKNLANRTGTPSVIGHYVSRHAKEADIVLLDANALNVVAPLNNVPGAIVTLMDRSNVDTVIVAGTIRKWKGTLLGTNLAKLRADLEASRDYLFDKTGVARDLFRACSARKLKTNREVIGADYDASFVVYIRWTIIDAASLRAP